MHKIGFQIKWSWTWTLVSLHGKCQSFVTFIHTYFYNVHSSPKVMAVYLILIFDNFSFGWMFSIWRQYNWVGVQQFHKTKSGAKCLTQCVPRSKCDTILFFKIKFVLRELLDSVKFIILLWKFLRLEIDTPTPFLPRLMVIEPVDTKPWLVNSDRPWRLNGSISSRQPQ